MHQFWGTVIKPLFEAVAPREIVEIGADYGDNTRNILDYCRQTDSRAHIIDPQPRFDPEEFHQEYGDHFIFYQSLSLNALPRIGRMEAVLIDGDHNWYTVYHELKLIEQNCQKNGVPFPLVLLHDVAWPYGRRDMYYDPQNIPAPFRLPYAQKGLDPDRADLVENGGLNPHLCNAIYEHSLKNGVLSAVEDFMRESGQPHELIILPVFHGLGILYPSVLKQSHPLFSERIGYLSAPDIFFKLLTEVEKSRIKTRIAGEEATQKLTQQLKDSEAIHRQALEKADQEIRKLKHELKDMAARIEEIAAARAREAEQFRAEIETHKNRFASLEEKRRLENESYRRELHRLQSESQALRKAKEKLNREKDQYSQWISQLQEQFTALMQSNRWRVGHGLISLLTLSMFRKNVSMATDHIKRIFNQVAYFRAAFEPAALDQAFRLPQSPSLSKIYPKRRYDLTVAVIAWDVGHNPLGRAYMLAEALSRYFHVVLLGPLFSRYNTRVWEPLQNARIEVIPFPGEDFPEFLTVLEKAARRIEADIILACKPRLPSVQLGLMMKAFKNRPLFIDIDDYELSFFKQRTSLTFEDIQSMRKYEDIGIPFEETWTRFTESLLCHADGLFVSNPALEKKFGGVRVPHARDELRFDPSLYDPNRRRRELGIGEADKVVLFLGTPREHKGVAEVLEAVLSLKKDHYKLCIIGTPPDKHYENRLRRIGGNSLIMLPDQPFDRIAENLTIADLVCLIQDPENAISKYQLPAKVIDAMAMGIPVLATRTPPLEPLIQAGAVEALDPKELPKFIDRILSGDRTFFSGHPGNRDLFLQRYSYAAIAETLCDTMLAALDHPKPLAPDALDFIEIQKKISSKRPAKKETPEDGGMDIVLFWKQNDTGIYGRRSDMFIKHLSRRPQIRRIAVFDMPVSIEALREKAEQNGINHDRLIYRETLLRNWGMRDTDKISFHTFIYQTGTQKTDRQAWRFPDKAGYMGFIEARLQEVRIEPSRAVFWFYPENSWIMEIAKRFRPRLKVVDLVDDHRTWSDRSEIARLYLTKHYKEVLKTADLAFANCERVRQTMQNYHHDIRLIQNGCELTPPPDLSRDRRFQWFEAINGPKLGYVGNLEKEKIDAELIKYLAGKRPDWNIFLIGSTHANPEILDLDGYSNIHFLGVIPYPEVRAWIKAFDVAILPHLNSEKTRSMNPLKLYVYCSLGVPVVSTDIENLDALKSFVSIADGYDDFIKRVELSLEKKGEGISQALKDCLAKNTWDNRVDQILDAIRAKM